MIDRAQLTAWMAAAADGDRAALAPLFHALRPLAVSYARRILGTRAELAEDCAQTALARLFGQLDQFDRTRDALTWTLTHVTWECRTQRRRASREAERAAPARATAASGDALDGRADVEHRDLVRRALAEVVALAPGDAEVIVAALVDDDAFRDALKPATFRKRLERALARLRGAWKERHEST